MSPSAQIEWPLLAAYRDRAERVLNAVRGVVLLLLGSAALAYAPSLTPALNRANVCVLVPALLWTAAQYALYYRRPVLPRWLSVANPVVDITAVTAILGAYALADSASLAFKTPIFLAYFVILAARPITSSTRIATAAAVLAIAQYAALVGIFLALGLLTFILDPIAASRAAGVSPLDEGAKLLLLGVAGGIAAYATSWQEGLATSYARESQRRERLETQLAEAELQALKLQLHPHFLFNTLNTITALIHTNGRAAERMVSGLSELLRLSLRGAGEQEVPLARELDMLAYYIDIQQVRFPDRLHVTFAVEPDARPALVPHLILQPLVENAIRHGIAPRAAPGHVEVHAAREGDVLRLRVADDGVGEHVDGPRREGVGLGNTRARLASLYGPAHEIAVRRGPAGGFVVDIGIPYHVTARGIMEHHL